MKKIYLSLCVLASALGANAQQLQEQHAKSRILAHTSTLEQPIATPSVAATGDTISGLYYDFSDPSEWVFGNTSNPSANWVIGTGVPSGGFAIPGILSTTAANGFALFDSDGLGSNSSAHNAWVQLANPVDLTGFNSVAVAFQQYYRKFQDDVFVEVSTNGTTWTAFEVNASLAVNSSTTNPNLASVNISSVAANQAQVWIRFRFQGAWDYAWMVDDVAFVEGATNDIILNNVWHGDILNAWEYEQIPLSQVQEVVIGAAIANMGGLEQTNISFTYDISLSGSSVASGTFAANSPTLQSAISDTTWLGTGYTPSAAGVYTLSISVSSDQVDEVPANNTLTSTFRVTDFIYGHDNPNSLTVTINGGTDANNNPNTYKLAAFYQMFEDATLRAVQVAFGPTTTSASCLVEVFDITNDPDRIDPIISEVYDIAATDLSTANTIKLINIPIDGGEGYLLSADIVYLIVVGNVDVSGGRLVLYASDGDDDLGGRIFGPFGENAAIAWFLTDFSPLIRANFDPSVGIAENADLTGIQMFPNPANDVITVKFNANESNDILINVIAMDGKVVYTENAQAFSGQFTSRINLNGLSTGLYSVQVMSNNSVHTQKVAVVK